MSFVKDRVILFFSVDAIWRFKAPTKACFLAYVATKWKMPIEDIKRRISIWPVD